MVHPPLTAMKVPHALLFLVILAFAKLLHADDGYRLWLRYDLVQDESLRKGYLAHLGSLVLPEHQGATLKAAAGELRAGLSGLLGVQPLVSKPGTPGSLRLALFSELEPSELPAPAEIAAAGEEGYLLRSEGSGMNSRLLLCAKNETGLLYGSFALLRRVQTGGTLANLRELSAPRVQRRMLDHWDNPDRSMERVFSGQSIWEWFELPDYVSPRYRDYARACASVGINGTVLNNVNSNALFLTREWLQKTAAIATALRPYGLRVYLCPRFSAPMGLGGLKDADPLDPTVQAWWQAKVDEIYQLIPDFGGFLVKANSEGEPGPQDYGRNHADGANMLARALAPHGGIVLWRAFVYDSRNTEDRARQAFNEFTPLDGKFLPNVVIQIKNGPIDFMPREPFHPLFGAMPASSLALEVQITQEYLGGSIHLAYLANMWKETLDSDTWSHGQGSTVARVVDGSLDAHQLTAIAGVANVGTDRNWCGHPLLSANWYAFGRLAWDHSLSPDHIADEWIRQNFPGDETVVSVLKPMLLESREAVVNYSMPLGLHHIMAYAHHYGPGPWVETAPRPDWTCAYYHRAAKDGIGFDRTSTGSRALEQYKPEAARLWAEPSGCPDDFLLWFHHLPWDFRMKSGRSLWDELCLHYQAGVNSVRGWQRAWDSLETRMDAERFSHVKVLLARQEREAREWRDGCLLYFQTHSGCPLPSGVEPAEHPLEYYKDIRRHFVPGSYNAK